MFKPSYSLVGLGGTFDHFHAGHAQFLKFAAQQGKRLIIGITDPKLTLHKAWPESIQSFSLRNKAVVEFCHQHQIDAETFRLTDPYGPTLEKSRVEALVVTEATIAGAQNINSLRSKIGLRELPVHVCSLLKASSGEILSSTLIRDGKCNREGKVYHQIITTDFKLNDQQRAFFQQPQGKVVTKPTASQVNITCVVGDYCLNTFLEQNWSYTLGVFDGFTSRETSPFVKVNQLGISQKAPNHPGEISLSLMKVLQKIDFSTLQHLFIEGEEDLVTVALVLLLPLEAKIYYGQPEKGMVELTVTEKIKQAFYQVLSD